MKFKPRTYNYIKFDISNSEFGETCILRDCCNNELCYDSSNNCISHCCEIMEEKSIGLIVDEVREYFPEFVLGGDSNSIGTVSYILMVPLLIAAIQEQQEIIEAEKTKVADLEAKNATLETQMADVLARLSALENP